MYRDRFPSSYRSKAFAPGMDAYRGFFYVHTVPLFSRVQSYQTIPSRPPGGSVRRSVLIDSCGFGLVSGFWLVLARLRA